MKAKVSTEFYDGRESISYESEVYGIEVCPDGTILIEVHNEGTIEHFYLCKMNQKSWENVWEWEWDEYHANEHAGKTRIEVYGSIYCNK